jgi:hypothetical protein
VVEANRFFASTTGTTMSDLKMKMQEQLARATQKARDQGYEAGHAAGYAAALKDLEDLSSSNSAASPLSVPKSSRRSPGIDYQPSVPRGFNAGLVRDALKSIAPRAAGPTEIISIVKRDNGAELAYSSTKHAINQLVARGECEQSGDLKLWRYRSPNANVVGLKSR